MDTITLNEISNDFLEAYERVLPLSISGTTTLSNDTIISVFLNGKTYTDTVSEGTFSVEVSADDILDLEDDSTYTVIASSNGIEDTEDVSTGKFKLGVQETHSVNIIETAEKRFVSDNEIQEMLSRLNELETRIFQQSTTPTTGVNAGDVWLDTSDDTLKVYREYPLGTGVYRWEPLIYKNNDTVDGGSW